MGSNSLENYIELAYGKKGTPERNKFEAKAIAKILLLRSRREGLKIKSVAVPLGWKPKEKTEEELFIFLKRINNVFGAFYEIAKKFIPEGHRVDWRNNKIQNQRYLELTNQIDE